MVELLTAAQMRMLEKAAMDSGAATGLELMERAGQGVVEAIFKEWPDLARGPFRAVVLCGPGNNGGDGFVVARLLKAWGWAVDVFLEGDTAKLPRDARVNHDRWAQMGGVRPLAALEGAAPGADVGTDLASADLVVDALFGTGLTRPVEGAARRVLSAPGPSILRRVAVDVPSGLCSDSGKVLGGWDMGAAALTVTFHRARAGHFLGSAPFHCGRLVVADIGLSGNRPEAKGLQGGALLVGPPDAGSMTKARAQEAPHKFTYGHVAVLSGTMGRTGAARMSARGALRIGAGLVTVLAPGSAMQECAGQLTAIMLRRCDGAEDLSSFLEDDRLNALCLGPGLGLGEAQATLVGAALASGRACVLDADALTLLAGDAGLFAALHAGCVLTPHAGEFARLFPDIADRLNAAATRGPAYSKIDAAREAAGRAGCVVVFKGPDTVIAAPDGYCSLHAAQYDRAAPWLATAGTGDVLAGLICGLLARGFAPVPAAEAAAWLHVECALRFGPGLIAEDIPEILPSVLRDLRD